MELVERILLIGLVVFLLLALVRFKYIDFSKKKKQRRRFERGNMLEVKAKSFLESKGYCVIEDQKIFYHSYDVNGESRSSKLIVDYIAEKNGKKYIVEVKSGKSAISLSDKNSRRQLLEYDFVIDNDGVILLDMENQNIQLVKFQSKGEKKETKLMKVIVIISGLAIFLPFWSLKIMAFIFLSLIWFYPNISKNVLTKIIGDY